MVSKAPISIAAKKKSSRSADSNEYEIPSSAIHEAKIFVHLFNLFFKVKERGTISIGISKMMPNISTNFSEMFLVINSSMNCGFRNWCISLKSILKRMKIHSDDSNVWGLNLWSFMLLVLKGKNEIPKINFHWSGLRNENMDKGMPYLFWDQALFRIRLNDSGWIPR